MLCGFQILVANEMACELFGFSCDELIGIQLSDLITLKAKGHSTILETHLEETGEIVEVSGKVVSTNQAQYSPVLQE